MLRSRLVLVVSAITVLLLTDSPDARQAAARVPVAIEEALAADPPAQEAAWSFADLGEDIGQVALFAARNGTRTEIIGAGRFHWYVHDYDPAGKRLRLLYFSPGFRVDNEIVGLAVSRLAVGAEILVALEDGTVMRYDHATRRFFGQGPGLCAGRGGAASFAAADLYGSDGVDEQMFICADQYLVVGGAGYATWAVANQAEFGWGGHIAAGQLDADAAIEIVLAKGGVVDSATHAVQWQVPPEFGTPIASFRIGDLNGDGRNELVFGRPWRPIHVYDVAAQSELRSFTPAFADVRTIHLEDIDGNGDLELLTGDGQWGSVHVYDPVTFAEMGAIANPEHGVTNLATFDADGDGAAEIVWGAGATSTGSDRLYLAKWTTRTIIWESMQLDGPFIGPVSGDLDGDGKPEIVAASHTSEAEYFSGRIVVLNGKTLAVRAVSPGVSEGTLGWTGIWDLKLRDIDGDGQLEILVATDRVYDGVIEAYRFTPPAQFDLVWKNTTRPFGSPFGSVEVADLDGDGVAEILGATRAAHTGSIGTFIYAYDITTGAEKWRVPISGVGQFTDIDALVVSTFGVSGQPKAVALLHERGLAVVDGLTRTHTATFHADATWIGMLGSKLLVGDAGGEITSYRLRRGLFTAQTTRTFLTGRIDGARLKSDFSGWVAGGGVLRYFDAVGSVLTKSAYYGGPWGDEPFGRWIHLVGGKLDMALSGGAAGVHGIKVPVLP